MRNGHPHISDPADVKRLARLQSSAAATHSAWRETAKTVASLRKKLAALDRRLEDELAEAGASSIAVDDAARDALIADPNAAPKGAMLEKVRARREAAEADQDDRTATAAVVRAAIEKIKEDLASAEAKEPDLLRAANASRTAFLAAAREVLLSETRSAFAELHARLFEPLFAVFAAKQIGSDALALRPDEWRLDLSSSISLFRMVPEPFVVLRDEQRLFPVEKLDPAELTAALDRFAATFSPAANGAAPSTKR